MDEHRDEYIDFDNLYDTFRTEATVYSDCPLDEFLDNEEEDKQQQE
jgi:hypothetical protein